MQNHDYAPSARNVAFLIDAITSHTISSLGVARRLQQRGYAVEYWGSTTNRAEAIIRDSGFVYRPIEGLWSRFREDIRLPPHLTTFGALVRVPMLWEKLQARRALKRQLPSAIDSCKGEIDRLISITRPAFVVVDPFLLAYYPLLWAQQVPTVALSTKPLPVRDRLVPPYDSTLLPPQTVGARVVVRLCWTQRWLRDVGYRTVAAAARRAGGYTYRSLLLESAQRTGFPWRRNLVNRWLHPDMHFKTLQEWALWLPETDLPRTRPLPGNVSFIGPSVDPSRENGGGQTWWDGSRRYRVYVAVGTVRPRWRQNVQFLLKMLEAFRNMPEVQVVMSTSDERATQALGTPPPNVRVFDFVPQLDVLKDADLVVTHAGAGTYRECIHYRVPVLAFPRNHDQPGNAVRVAFHGIGLRGDRIRDSADEIRRKVYRLLTDRKSFVGNLQRLNAATRAREEQLLTEALQRLSAPASMPPMAAIAAPPGSRIRSA